MSYDPEPRYPIVGGHVLVGYAALAADLGRRGPGVVALDGPAALPWERFAGSLTEALEARGVQSRTIDVRTFLAPWDEVQRRTASAVLPGDPVFARIHEGALEELFDELPQSVRSDSELTILLGPGSALIEHDLLWYVDLPKRLSLEAIREGLAGNLGQPPGSAGSEQRLLFIDWPLLDRHKHALAAELDLYVDCSKEEVPRGIDGDAMRRSLGALGQRPFRTRPTFLPGPWGGQWLRRSLSIETAASNLAWSYELITPESGVVLDDGAPVEVAFELLMAVSGEAILGAALQQRFGASFPIRFDYLDTLEGGHLSIQTHPTEDYMREVFGLQYTQHETYYVMNSTRGATIFLGLREDADLDAFRTEAERAEQEGRSLDPERYLQTHPSEQHRLYLIPAGTPHASGAGNVVLEISATPYLYTLRFYDWLRRDLAGELRPVHVEHAFANIDPRRRGDAVTRDLMPEPSVVRSGSDWSELALARSPDLFFAVHRLDFAARVEDDTEGRFHALNLVEGGQVEVEWSSGGHRLEYAESIVIPAAVGPYAIRRIRGKPAKVIKAFVP